VILACGGRAGFISEPLVARARGLRVAAPGPRVIGATPAGDGLAALDDEIAAAIHAPALVGIQADADQLRVVVVAVDQPPLAVSWTVGAGGHGWGTTRADVAWRAWRGGDGAALAGVAWAESSSLAAVILNDEDRKALLEAAAGDGIARLAACRLLSQPAAPAGPAADWPDWLAREIVLRDLSRGLLASETPAAGAIVRGADEHVLVAALRALAGPHRPRVLALLSDRLTAQAAGGLPFAEDPLLQHRLVAAVFDATDLSPTPLRPLAVALRDRLDPLARGPVDRFLARHGEVRPATPAK